jgi:hypothetical protein
MTHCSLHGALACTTAPDRIVLSLSDADPPDEVSDAMLHAAATLRCNNATMQRCNETTLRCNNATMQRCNATTLQRYAATAQRCDAATK